MSVPPPPAAGGPTVGSVAAEGRLGLRVLVGGDGLDRPVLASHTSELRDPTPWLHGGELLMTTGLQLETDGEALLAYVQRLAAAGVACLGVGTGPQLTLSEVPQAFVDAARLVGLPLFEVPEQTPFVAVTETVYAQLAASQYAEQLRALEAQKSLTAAALHPGGLLAISTSLAGLTGMSVLVTDASGATLAVAGPDADSLSADLLPEVERLRSHGLRATASVLQPGRDVRVQPLGSHALRGFVVCAGTRAPGAYERQLVASAISLLTLELERMRSAGDADRRRRADVATALLTAPLPEPAALELLASVGVHATRLLTIVVRDPQLAADDVVERLAAQLPGLLASEQGADLVLLVPDPAANLAVVVAAALGDLAAGLGGPGRPGGMQRSLQQARRAVQVAIDRGGGTVDVRALASAGLLLALDGSGAVSSYAEAVLGPLDRAGARGEALTASLRAFLERNGSWDEAAALVGVHRHTLRQRLKHVEELTGRRLDSGRDRMELLLAFEARDLELPG